MPALAPNSLIAITGITGLVGSHVGLAALEAGHRVRGTVRSLEAAQILKESYVKRGILDIDSRLEFVIVDDLLSIDQYERALEGVDGVAHVALPMQGWDNKFVYTAVGIVTALLQAAKQVPSIKRVVITSSIGAVIMPPSYVDRTLTEKDWNEEAVRTVEENETNGEPSPPLIAYSAAKTKSEKAAWEFMKEEKPQFDLTTVLVSVTFGPVLGKAQSTAKWIGSLLETSGPLAYSPSPQWWADARDCGKVHIMGLIHPPAAGRRIIAAATSGGWNQIFAILRKHFPNAQVPDDIPGDGGEPDKQQWDNSFATEMLGGWVSLEKSIVDCAKSLGY